MLQGSKSIAVLLCNFTNSLNPRPYTKKQVEDAFMGLNSTSINAFWIENSKGHVNLNGTKVFDWVTIPMTRGYFSATYSQDPNRRHNIIEAAKSAVGANFSNFATTIVLFSDSVGTAWSTNNGSIFDLNVDTATNICHELGHLLGGAFGVTDSFDFTNRVNDVWAAPGMYFDQTDIMSAQNVWADGRNPDGSCFDMIGPNFSPVHKDHMGWLDASTVKNFGKLHFSRKAFVERITLKSRSIKSTGIKTLQLSFDDEYYIELATQDGFDGGLQGAGVLIHTRSSGLSYVIVPDLAKPDEKFWKQNMVFSKTFSYKSSPQSIITKHATIYLTIGELNVEDKTVLVSIANTPMFFPATGEALEIVAVRMYHSTAGGGFNYIGAVGVKDRNGGIQVIERYDVVDWIYTKRNTFFVLGSNNIKVNVIIERHWIKTEDDDDRQNNLLSLPRI